MGEQAQGFQKPFFGGKCVFTFVEYLYNLNSKNQDKKFQKLYFDFSYCCKLPEWARCFTPFKL